MLHSDMSKIQSFWSGDPYACYNPPANLKWSSLCTLSNVNMTLQPNASSLISPDRPESYDAYDSCCPDGIYSYRRDCGLSCISYESYNSTWHAVSPWMDCMIEKGWARDTPGLWCQNQSNDAPQYEQVGPKISPSSSNANTHKFGVSGAISLMLCTLALVCAYA